MSETSTAAPPEQAPDPAPAARRARTYQPGRMRTKHAAIGTGLLAGGTVAAQSLVTFGPAATIVGGAATAVTTSGAYVAAKTRKRRAARSGTARRRNPAQPGAAARRSLATRARAASKKPTSNSQIGQTRKQRRSGKPGIPGWSAGRKPRTGSATQRAAAGQKPGGGWRRRVQGPRNRDKNGRFGRGHSRKGMSATATPTSKKALRASAARNRPGTVRGRAATQARRWATARARTKLARAERKVARRNGSRPTTLRNRSIGNTRGAARNLTRPSTVRPIGGRGRRSAHVFGKLWFWFATKVGNGVRSMSLVHALAAPFHDSTRPASTPQPKPAEAQPAAKPKPAAPTIRDEMNLPEHPVTASKNPANLDHARADERENALATAWQAPDQLTPEQVALLPENTRYALAYMQRGGGQTVEAQPATKKPVTPEAPTGRNTTMAHLDLGLSDAAARISRWEPETPEETQAMLRALAPELTALGKAFNRMGDMLGTEFPYADVTPQGLNEIGKFLTGAAATAAESMPGEFRVANETDLNRRENPRVNERHFNVP